MHIVGEFLSGTC